MCTFTHSIMILSPWSEGFLQLKSIAMTGCFPNGINGEAFLTKVDLQDFDPVRDALWQVCLPKTRNTWMNTSLAFSSYIWGEENWSGALMRSDPTTSPGLGTDDYLKFGILYNFIGLRQRQNNKNTVSICLFRFIIVYRLQASRATQCRGLVKN